MASPSAISMMVERIVSALPHDRRRALGLGLFEAPLLERLASFGIEPWLLIWRPGRDARAPRADCPILKIVSLRYLLEHCHDPLARSDQASNRASRPVAH
jgi:hypothetical protein